MAMVIVLVELLGLEYTYVATCSARRFADRSAWRFVLGLSGQP